MRRSAVLTIFALLLAACAEDPATGPASGPAEPQVDQTRMSIYESLAREVVGSENIEWKKIVIVSVLCDNAGGAEVPEGCDDELSAAEQDELALRLDDLGAPISFVEDPTPLYDDDWMTGAPQILVLRLGTIAESGNAVEVGGSYGCGGLCGGGTTYVLEERTGGWEITGTKGMTWIA
ncbi:MAG TPA: hypothetical protein VNP90_00065 [Actinomycetota bacterium]|nr:hypothetical protein [Actinomycetota bacterium]